MPEDPNARLNDQINQQAHAAEIKQRTADRRAAAEGKDAGAAQMEAMITTRVEQAIQRAFANLTIQAGNGIRISGSGRNMTIAWEPPATPAAGALGAANTGGEWREFEDCDGNTFDVWSRNFTAPP